MDNLSVRILTKNMRAHQLIVTKSQKVPFYFLKIWWKIPLATLASGIFIFELIINELSFDKPNRRYFIASFGLNDVQSFLKS
jgi:hypothetical protein